MSFLFRSAPSSSSQVGVNSYNFLVNGAFDYWQAGTSATVAATGGATPTNTYLYQADQWYVNNTLGGGTVEGIITYSQQAAASGNGAPDGSLYRAKVQITTAPTGAGIQNGCELWQTLSNKASLSLYNKTASASVYVLGLGNVTQVGLQFFYSTSESKATIAIGSEVLTTINSSTWTLCSINGQALGSSMTTSGTIGLRIRITGVSSGNTYDLNNGFQVEQAMVNIGTSAVTFARQSPDPLQELAACQYFYEKSYDPATSPGSNTLLGMFWFPTLGTATNQRATITFAASKRTDPSISFWDKAGNSGRTTGINAAGTETDNLNSGSQGTGSIGTSGFFINEASLISATAYTAIAIHWAADARL